MNLRTSPGFWALVLGVVGGTAGLLAPQGPMLGLFITGPGGAVAGTVLGYIFRILPFSDQVRTQALMLSCAALGLGTLWFAAKMATQP